MYAKPAAIGDKREIIIDSRKTPIPLQVDMDLRCRKCRNCLRFRTRQWTARAVYEIRVSERTWFATFTFRPEEHDRIVNLSRMQYAETGADFDLLADVEQFHERHKRCSKWLTLWLKRVRKNSGAKMRYLLVLEAHKSGLPHYHALIHEPLEEERVTKRLMEEAWPHGFTSFKLIEKDETRAAYYACKYLNKSALARVRASARYGGASPIENGPWPK